jgi:DNA-binding beta-propeller fold protein YncE
MKIKITVVFILLSLASFILILVHATATDTIDSSGEDWKSKIYWANYGSNKIAQANYDGSDRTFFVDTGSGPNGIFVDVKNGFMYWTNYGGHVSKALDGSIQRCQMDNCSSTTITIVGKGKTATPGQLTLDGVNGYIYWSDSNRDLVLRSKLDSLNVETVLILKDKTGVEPYGCEIDEENGVLYWSERNSNRIGRVNIVNLKMPYTPKESDYIVTEDLNGPGQIKIDTGRREIFITERFDNQISSVSLEGGIPDVIVDSELSEPTGLAIDREKGIIFISEFRARDINSVNMDGSNFKKICDSGGKFVVGMFFVPKID